MSNTNKFIRNYVMEIETTFSAQNPSTPPAFLTLQGTASQPCPFTLEFDIVRNISNSAQANFRIYNLNAGNRQAILRDAQLAGTFQLVRLYAGYGLDVTQLPLVFAGYATIINSNREGVNAVTTIECIGFDYQHFYYSNTFNAGISNQQMITQVAESFTGIQVGAIGTFPGTPPTGQSYSDFGVRVLSSLTNDGFFIDNLKSYCLQQNECLENSEIPIIDAGTGLLGSPVRRMTEIKLTMLFEPRLRIAQFVQVNSVVNAYLNNTGFKVWGIVHKGVISPAVNGSATTEISLQSLTNPIFVSGN